MRWTKIIHRPPQRQEKLGIASTNYFLLPLIEDVDAPSQACEDSNSFAWNKQQIRSEIKKKWKTKCDFLCVFWVWCDEANCAFIYLVRSFALRVALLRRSLLLLEKLCARAAWIRDGRQRAIYLGGVKIWCGRVHFLMRRIKFRCAPQLHSPLHYLHRASRSHTKKRKEASALSESEWETPRIRHNIDRFLPPAQTLTQLSPFLAAPATPAPLTTPPRFPHHIKRPLISRFYLNSKNEKW